MDKYKTLREQIMRENSLDGNGGLLSTGLIGDPKLGKRMISTKITTRKWSLDFIYVSIKEVLCMHRVLTFDVFVLVLNKKIYLCLI